MNLLEAAAADGYTTESPSSEPIEQVQVTETSSQEVKQAPDTSTTEVQQQEAAKPAEIETEKPKSKPSLGDTTKKPWERLSEKAPEAKTDEAATDKTKAEEDDLADLPEGTNEAGKATWKTLKQAARERDAMKVEMAQLQEKLRTAAPEKADAIQKELDDLRREKTEIEQLVAERRLEQSTDYQKTVIEPRRMAESQIAKLIELGGLPQDKMAKAVGLNDPIERAAAITEILDNAESDYRQQVEAGEKVARRPLSAILQTQLHNAVGELHSTWAKEDNLKAEARNIQSAAEARDAQLQAQREKAAEAEWTAARDAMQGVLAKKLTDVFSDDELAAQAIEQAVKAVTPEDQAYQAFAGALLPMYVQEAQTLKARVAELEGVIKAKGTSRPSMSGANPEAPERKGPTMSLLEAAAKDGYA